MASSGDQFEKKHLEVELRGLFGERFKPGGGDGLIGTVWPEDEADVADLIVLARREEIPLVPRGAGTSPYAGSVAMVESIAVSFERMNRVLRVDEEQCLATVQSGVVWSILAEQLRAVGLMPRVYPSSDGVSTVGGFVAQNGVGIGSFQFGTIADTVAGVRVVSGAGNSLSLGDGSVELVAGAEGRTGLLTAITLRVQKLADMTPLVAVFKSADALEAALIDIARKDLPLWSVTLMDPMAVSLIPVESDDCGPGLPLGRYAVLFSFRSLDRLGVVPQLRGVILGAGGAFLDVRGSNDQWLHRFMTLQALQTTPVPMQFRLPLGQMTELLRRIAPRKRAQLGFEGVVAHRAKSLTLRFFLPSWPRSVHENLDMAVELLYLVKTVGGETYATGAYFLEEANSVYGPEILSYLERFRAISDPSNLLNPGKGF